MPTLSKKSVAIASLLVVMFALLSLMGGALYAQSTAGDIPLFGKIQKGFHDPSKGIVDAWHVDYEVGATLPTGARASGTVFHHLETLVASSGTHVAAGGSFPSNNVDGTIFLANAHFTVTAGVAQDIAGADITQIQQGDTYRYNGSNSHWIEISGFGFIPDDTILERMLKIQGNPALGECLSWDGTDIEWSTCAAGAIAVADGSITTDKLHDGAATGPKLAVGSVSELKLLDGAVTEPKLAMYNRPAHGEVVEWDQVGNRMQWSPVNSLSLADSSITEPKLDMHNSPAHGEVIEWDQVANRMQWSPVSSPTLADNSVTEPKLYMYNTPIDGHVIEWDQATGRMQWTSVGNLSLLDLSVTSNKLAENAVTEPKLALGSDPTDNQIITWNTATSSMDWEDVAQAGIGTGGIDSDQILDGTIQPVDIQGGAVVTDKIKDGNVTEPKLAISNGPADGQFLKWDTNSMEWASVTTGIPDNNSVTSAKIVDGEVKTVDIGAGAVTGAKIQDGVVTEPKLAISGTPTIGDFLRWDSGGMDWEAVTTGVPAANSITSAMIIDGEVKQDDIGSGAVTGAKIQDGVVTEPKLDISGTQGNGLVVTWDSAIAGGAMQWAQIIMESVEDDAITEPKLRISNVPSSGEVITWDTTVTSAPTMKWATAGSGSLGDDSVTEPKLKIQNTAANGNALLWDGSSSPTTMKWGEVDATTLATNAVSTVKIQDDAVTTDKLDDDAVTADKLHENSVTSSHIVDETIAESDLAITPSTTTGQAEYRLSWTGTAMNWIAPWKNVIELITTASLPSSASELGAMEVSGLIGETKSADDALAALYYKGESDADEIQIRMDDITDRSHFAIGRAIGYNSGSVQPSVYGKGGAIFPTDPPGLTLLIEVEIGGGDWHMQMLWGSTDRPSFGTATGSVIYIQYQLAGTTTSTRQKMTLEADAGWTSHPLGGGYATQKFTPHSTYIFSFWNAATGGAKYTIPDVVEDHLAKLVDERRLQDSDGKIIDRINDVYAKTAHGSYRGDFDKTREGGYGKGDVVTAKGSETGDAQTNANTVIYIARNDITKGTGNLDQPHEDDGNWLEISNGFEDVLLNEAVSTPSAVTGAEWNEKNLDRAITADDNERDIVLEFEHTTGTQINAPSIFTHVVMGPVDRWLTLTAKPTSEQNFEESMCAMMPGPFSTTSFTPSPTMNVVCIARNSGAFEMLIYVQNTLPSVRTYITLK